MPARFDQPSIQDAAALLTFGAGLGLLHLHYRLTGRLSLTARLLDLAIRRIDAAWQRRYYDL